MRCTRDCGSSFYKNKQEYVCLCFLGFFFTFLGAWVPNFTYSACRVYHLDNKVREPRTGGFVTHSHFDYETSTELHTQH